MPSLTSSYYSHSALYWQFVMAGLINILSLALPIMMLQVYDRIIPHQSYGTLALLTAGVVTALLLDAGLRAVRAYTIGWLSERAEEKQNAKAMQGFLYGDIREYEKHRSGEHLQNMMAISRLREFYSGQSMIALIDVPFALLFVALIAYIGGWVAVVPVTLLAVFAVVAIAAGTRLKQSLEKRHEEENTKWNMIVSILSSMHTVKSMGAEDWALRRYEKKQAGMTRCSYDVARETGHTSILSALFGQVTLVATVTVGCLFVMEDALTVGSLSACTLLAGRTIQPVQRLLGTWLRFQDLAIAQAGVAALFSHTSLRDAASDAPLTALSGHGRLEVKNLSLGYDDERLILGGVNLDVKPGECVALRGEKGCGKSTFLQAVAGLLPVKGGTIRVDGLTPSDYASDDLMHHVGYLPQDGTIFKGTILDNITGFRRDDAMIEKAKHGIRELGLEDIIHQLPDGYHTMLQDNEADAVPPGVKQRICLLRILVHMPRLLLFDDADRTIDKEGYNHMYRYLGRLKGKTSIVLATHDENLLSLADRHYVLRRGVLQPIRHGRISHLSWLHDATRGGYG